MTTALEHLQQWFSSQCDDDWEHTHGISIETLDNPGWRVAIDVRGTPLEHRPPVEFEVERQADDWIDVRVEAGKFEAHGGPQNLAELLTIFRDWARGTLEPPAPERERLR